MSLRILSVVAAVLLSASAATAQTPCANGTCTPFGIRIPAATLPVGRSVSAGALSHPSAPLRSRLAGAFMSGDVGQRSHKFFADRRGLRTVFVRR